MRLLLLCSVVALVAGCDCGQAQPCSDSNPCPAGVRCVGGTCIIPARDAGRDASVQPDPDAGGAVDSGVEEDAGVRCVAGTACGDGGVCLSGGTCCGQASACGDACCGAAQVCFANSCVTPGALCRTSSDCGAGFACEPGLLDAGARDAGTCGTGPVTGGRCVALPPRCPELPDGGPILDGGAVCIARCEYRPPVGNLDAVLHFAWGQPVAPLLYPDHIDVWSTPVVGRFADSNCDGVVDALDSPNLIFVSNRTVNSTSGLGTCCHCTGDTPHACRTGMLRVLDGRTGRDLLTVQKPSPTSVGFSGVSMALADIDNDRAMELLAVTGEGFLVALDGQGRVKRTSNVIAGDPTSSAFGWGGGLSVADMDGDGAPEVVFASAVFTTADGGLTLRFRGALGIGGGSFSQALSTLADVDLAPNGHLELITGQTAYRADGGVLWDRPTLPDGFPAVADVDLDGLPDVVVVGTPTSAGDGRGRVWVLEGSTGATKYGPFVLPGLGGGPPTVADFDGTPGPEIGVAQQTYYTVVDLTPADGGLRALWSQPNHDLSSNVTGSTVFDFEGDGVAEVLYQDECFVWVYDGPTGRVKFAGLTTSFTGTESSVVADLDGDGHAEMISVANGADPSSMGWGCDVAPWNQPNVDAGRPAWRPPAGATAHRGIKVYRDASRSWVGTRPIWNQHTYHVTNVCTATDAVCAAPTWDGKIPSRETRNWSLPWLNNFRQNVQQEGLFYAPDAVVSLAARCAAPPLLVASVRNVGEAVLPAGVVVGLYVRTGVSGEQKLGEVTTTSSLFPGGAQELSFTAPNTVNPAGPFFARILVDPVRPAFRECRSGNNESAAVSPVCIN